MIEAQLTGDGSYTLYDADSDECYHSHKGALTESEFVFVAASGLRKRLLEAKSEGHALVIIEMGLGTGLNYLLSARLAYQLGVELQYHALENNLLKRSSIEHLKFNEIPGMSDVYKDYLKLDIHAQQLPQGHHGFSTITGQLHLHHGDALQCALPVDHFELCFYDAFSPKTVPALWQRAQLQKFYDCLKPGGSWVSYCASGAVRRNLVNCGFLVDRLPGPPGKREMLRANKPNALQLMPTN